jgi:hypothetical protein
MGHVRIFIFNLERDSLSDGITFLNSNVKTVCTVSAVRELAREKGILGQDLSSSFVHHKPNIVFSVGEKGLPSDR